jgi:hypothetical protein
MPGIGINQNEITLTLIDTAGLAGEILLLTLTPSIDRRLRQQNCGIILIFCWLLISPMYRKNTF